MTLCEFVDEIWTRKNVPILLCPASAYDDMFDKVDDINDGKADAEHISEYTLGAFLPHLTQYMLRFMIADKFADADVTHFYIGKGIAIVWIEEEGEKK